MNVEPLIIIITTELGYHMMKRSLAFPVTGPSLGEWFENLDFSY